MKIQKTKKTTKKPKTQKPSTAANTPKVEEEFVSIEQQGVVPAVHEDKSEKEMAEVSEEDKCTQNLIAEMDSDFEDDGQNSSDDEQDDQKEENAIDNLPTPPSVKSKKGKISKDQKDGQEEAKEKGVIYLGRIPHGFYEEQMKSYFSQFGRVTRLRLSRSLRTGRSKHYAFIEFKHKEAAEIVADTMDGYLLFGRILKCKLIPADKVHENLWKNCNRPFKFRPPYVKEMEKLRKNKTEEEYKKQCDRLITHEKKLRAKIAAAGIDYDFTGYSGTSISNK